MTLPQQELSKNLIGVMSKNSPEYRDEDAIRIWAVYNRPKDFPDHFVAREHLVFRGFHAPTDNFIQSKDLNVIREHMIAMGKFCLARHPNDDPNILESWL
jgi:hypothetical protein